MKNCFKLPAILLCFLLSLNSIEIQAQTNDFDSGARIITLEEFKEIDLHALLDISRTFNIVSYEITYSNETEVRKAESNTTSNVFNLMKSYISTRAMSTDRVYIDKILVDNGNEKKEIPSQAFQFK